MTAGAENPALYRTLKDVLDRQREIVSVRFEPDAIQKRYLVAEIDPQRVEPPTGPDSPRLTVHWKLTPPHTEFRVDYADPNSPFHCGWRRDNDHSDLGETHFQYETASMESPSDEEAMVMAESPPKILWEVCDELFATVIPDYTGDI